MDGVTILNTIVSNDNVAGCVIALILSIVLLLISLVGVYVFIVDSRRFNGYALAFVVLAIFSIIAMILGIVSLNSSTEATTYEVTISDEVSFTEFTSKYEIVEQRGEIYVVKEREQDE